MTTCILVPPLMTPGISFAIVSVAGDSAALVWPCSWPDAVMEIKRDTRVRIIDLMGVSLHTAAIFGAHCFNPCRLMPVNRNFRLPFEHRARLYASRLWSVKLSPPTGKLVIALHPPASHESRRAANLRVT